MFMNILKGNRRGSLLLQAVARMKYNQRNAWQMAE
jgi:hypothetical protein